MGERDDREARRRAIHSEAEDARREDAGYGGPKFLIGEEELEKLGVKRYSMDSGKDDAGKTHTWSFLDPKDGDPMVVALGLFIHWDVGGGTALCPREMKRWLEHRQIAVPEAIKDGRCPVCEEADRLVNVYKKAKDSLTEDERKKAYEPIKRLRSYNGSFTDPKPNRYLAWVVDEKDLDSGVQLVDIPSKVYMGLMNQADDPDTGETLDVTDPGKTGFAFSFKRWGKGKEGVNYDAFKLRPRSEGLDAEWLGSMPSFWQVVRFASYDDLKAMLEGTGSSGGREAEEDRPFEDRPSAKAEAESVKEQLAEEYGKGAPAEEHHAPRQRPRQPAAEAEPATRTRSAEPGPELGTTADPNAEAKALAERIRNRRRTREGDAK